MVDQPVARSAVSLPERPSSTQATVWLADRSNWSKVLIHHDDGSPPGAAFGKVVEAEEGALVVGWAPGQTLLISGGDTLPLLAKMSDADQKVDISHGHALLSIGGEGAEATLAKLCAIDLSEGTPPGSLVRTSVAKVATGVIKVAADQPSFLLICDRSYGQYLTDEVLIAAGEFGIATAAT